MRPGEVWRFSDRAFTFGELQRLNGLIFIVLSQVPAKSPAGIEPYGVKILVDGQVSEWSRNTLSCYAEEVQHESG